VRAVNLIPVDQRGGAGPAGGRSQGGAYAVPVLLGGLALLALLYGSARHEIAARASMASSLTAKTQQAQNAATQLAPYTSFLTLHQERVQAVTALAESRFDWAAAFLELGRVLPRGASISSLSGTVGSGTASGSSSSSSGGSAKSAGVASATPPGSVPTFVLTGCTTSQIEVAVLLNRLRLIDGVTNVSLESSTKPSGAGGSGASGGCPGEDPTFSATITFSPLPAASSAPSSAPSSPGASTATTTQPTGVGG
jgi:hypothetical protein